MAAVVKVALILFRYETVEMCWC